MSNFLSAPPLWQETIVLFLYLIALTFYKQKRNFYIIRYVSTFLITFFLCIPFGYIRLYLDGIIGRIIVNLLLQLCIVASLFVIYKEKISEILLCYTGITAAKNLSGQFFAFLLNCFGIDDLVSMSFFGNQNEIYDWIIYFLVHIILLSLIYIFLRKKENLNEPSYVRSISVASIALIVTSVIGSVARDYQSESFALSMIMKVLFIIIYALLLLFRSNIFFRDKITQELVVTEQLLKQEKRHYIETKNNIDLINMKCHDLKHQLNNLQDKLTKKELDDLKEALRIYDSNIKTGNEILDLVLYQKTLYATKNNINFKYIVDGEKLNFINGNDLYALTTNAVDNAFESVLMFEEIDKRIVSLSINFVENKVKIEISNNYLEKETNENLSTSKKDKIHHGYGIKSMQYITNKYKGTLAIEKDESIFTLLIEIPLI